MTVYIEYVLIENFVIDFFLLKATFSITGKRVKNSSVIIAATEGALCALLYPLVAEFLLAPLIKIAVGITIAFSAAEYKNLKDFYVNAVIFFALTFALGGAVIGAFNIFGINFSSEAAIAIMAAPAYLFIRFLKSAVDFLYRRKERETNLFDTQIVYKGKVYDFKGFCDTGNDAYDGESPVIFCDKKTAFKIIGKSIPELKRILISTVAGNTYLISFKVDEIKIFIEGRANIFNNVTIAVVKNAGLFYDVILHPALTEVKDELINAS